MHLSYSFCGRSTTGLLTVFLLKMGEPGDCKDAVELPRRKILSHQLTQLPGSAIIMAMKPIPIVMKGKDMVDLVGTPASWQSILGRIAKTSQERQLLASDLGVSIITLNRWISGESRPQRPHLIRLLQVINQQYRAELVDALKQDFPDIEGWLKDKAPEQVSPEFFTEILSIRSTTTDTLRFWNISEAVLKKGLTLLDPNNFGMALTICQCMPPSKDGKIRSLRERVGKGKPP